LADPTMVKESLSFCTRIQSIVYHDALHISCAK
jgi:hypothetical protein